MDIPNPDEAYRPENEAIRLGKAVILCLDKGMTYDEIMEVMTAAIEANSPRKEAR
jgi:hypothetical protein